MSEDISQKKSFFYNHKNNHFPSFHLLTWTVTRRPTLEFVHVFFYISSLSHLDLGVNKSSDVLEPAEVLLLLLGIDVVGDKGGQGLVDATLLEEALHQHLQVLVEAAKGRAGVDVGALLGGLGGVDASDFGVLVEEHVVDLDLAVAGGGVDVEGAVGLAGLLDEDGEVDGSAGLLVDVALEGVVGVLLLVGLEGLLGELVLLEHVLGVRVEVCDVGDGEADGDSEGKIVSQICECLTKFEKLTSLRRSCGSA